MTTELTTTNQSVSLFDGEYTGRTLWDVAQFITSADVREIIPPQYVGQPKKALVVFNAYTRMRLPWPKDPLEALQTMTVIKGKVTWSAEFQRRLWNECGKYEPIRYHKFGSKSDDTMGIQAYSAIKGDTDYKDPIFGPEVTLGMAKSEGWTSNKKWVSMPEIMLMNRATCFLVRYLDPGLLGGAVYDPDELRDMSAKAAVNDKTETINPYL